MKANYRSRVGVFCLFCLPLLALYLIFTFAPLIKTFFYAVTNWSGYGDWKFVGMDNFVKVFRDDDFWLALFNNVKFFLVGGVFVFGLALICAAMITQSKLKESKYYRIILYMPNIISAVVISVLWKFVFSPNFGLLNSLLDAVGLDHLMTNWLGTKETAFGAIMVVWVWSGFGYYMLLMIAAIEGIPTTFLEAAEIDGASGFQRFIHIVLPMVMNMVRTCLVFFTLNAFTGIYVLVKFMTDGGPSGTTNVVISYIYSTAFGSSKFGLSAAQGVVVCVLVGALILIMLKITKPKDELEY